MPAPYVSQNLKVGRDTLVHINVHPADSSHQDYWLQYFPQRRGDTQIYYTSPANAHKRSPTKPREVRWVLQRPAGADHLIVVVEAKNQGTGLLPQDEYVIDKGDNTIHSGEAQRGPGSDPGQFLWRYNLVLRDGARVIDTVDPDIIIKEDP